MQKKLTAAIAMTGISAAIALGLGGCGGSASGGEESGTLRATYASFPSYLDPALAYDTESYTALYNTYIPLLTYAHANGEAGGKVVPGLARELPKISNGGRTYTLFLRPGLKYSDGTPVRASDFTSSVERMFKLNSGGVPFYTDIVGAEAFLKTKRGGIAGIRTDDKSGKIVIDLTEPRGTFSNELGLLFVALVPPDTPAENQTADPPPATGPYAITSSQPGQGWQYERNPQWSKSNAKSMPDLPGGHVDRIDVTVIRNPSTQVNGVEQGKFDWMENPPPADRFAEVKSKYEGSQFRVEPQINTYYFWMNTQRAPFDDLKVRQAVNHAVDPAALERIYAGSLSGLQQVLPEGMPGHEQFELYPHDLAKAKEMIAQANPADREITVWTDNESPNEEAGDLLPGRARETRLRREAESAQRRQLLHGDGQPLDSRPRHRLDQLVRGLPEPERLLPAPAGRREHPADQQHQLVPDRRSRPQREDRQARPRTAGPEQEAEYAELDREFMEQAPWAPYGTLTVSTFVSSAIDLDKVIFNPTFGQDLTSFQFK